ISGSKRSQAAGDGELAPAVQDLDELKEEQERPKEIPEAAQKQFFDYPGPLFSARISPASSTVPVAAAKNFRALARDRRNRLVEQGVSFSWEIAEGEGRLENATGEIATFHAPNEPGLARLKVTVRQGEVLCSAEALVTVTDSLLPQTQLRH